MKQIYLLLITMFISLSTIGQNSEDTTDGKSQDDLLNHLVGKWNASGVVHGVKFEKMDFEAKWDLNHQYLHIRAKSADTIPWLHMKFEEVLFIGYNHSSQHYVVHEMNVFGSDDPTEGFCYAYQNGNQIKLIKKAASMGDTVSIQRFTWQPESKNWNITAQLEIAGKEQDVFINQKLEATKASPE